MKRRPSAAAGETRRDQILDTAADLFASRGFRTSLQEVAKACGILPGSLYHHFESKEAIVFELVERFQRELGEIAATKSQEIKDDQSVSMYENVLDFSEDITACGIRHTAALLQTLHEPPSNASPELIELARRTPRAIDNTMAEILRAGRANGELRPDINIEDLAEQLCQAMLRLFGIYHQAGGARNVPRIKTQMLLRGLAVTAPSDAELDRSPAFKIADTLIAGWKKDEGDDLIVQLRAAARSEFGKRGYESTTIRDIAAAAGMSTGAVYRLVRSKEELLDGIMASFEPQVSEGWDAVFACDATPVEKLDAATWLDINLMDRFGDEWKIMMAWLRQSPPTSTSLGKMEGRLKYGEALLEEGERDGHFRVMGGNSKVRARCLVDLTWISESIIRASGPRAALALARDTLIRGAMAKE
jgi:AcrR family transcriptional regulator